MIPPIIGTRLLELEDGEALNVSLVLVLLLCGPDTCVAMAEVVEGPEVVGPLLDADDEDVVDVAIVVAATARADELDDVLDVLDDELLVNVGVARRWSTVATGPHAIYEYT
jgi:hypothetical protein